MSDTFTLKLSKGEIATLRAALCDCRGQRSSLAGALNDLWQKLEVCEAPTLDRVPEFRTSLGQQNLIGQVVLTENRVPLGKISSLMDGSTKLHFGGPGRGCDYGDTWVYTREVHRLSDDTLIYVPE